MYWKIWGNLLAQNNALFSKPPNLTIICLIILCFQSFFAVYNNIVGTLNSDLSGLRELKRLLLEDNSLRGSSPSALWDVLHLNEILLDNNDFPGILTERCLHPSESKDLYLSNKRRKVKIHELCGRLFNLKDLYLDHNSLLGIISPIFANMTRLDGAVSVFSYIPGF